MDLLYNVTPINSVPENVTLMSVVNVEAETVRDIRIDQVDTIKIASKIFSIS